MTTKAMVKRWNAEALVQKVLDLDAKIKFCAVVDENGKLKAGGMRSGVKSREPLDKTSLIVLRTAIGAKAIEASDNYLSKTKFGIVCREDVTQIVFSLPEHQQLQVAADTSFPLEHSKDIEQILKKSISRRYYV
jgi:hypothetical protein